MSRSFTLIELLVVISIIGILMGIGFAAFKQAQAAGRDAKRKADLEQIKTALELFHEDCGKYPPTLDFSQTTFQADCDNNGTQEVYLAKMPKDPLYPTYTFNYGGSTNFHTLCAYFERGGGNVSCWDGLRGRYIIPTSCGNNSCNYVVTTVR